MERQVRVAYNGTMYGPLLAPMTERVLFQTLLRVPEDQASGLTLRRIGFRQTLAEQQSSESDVVPAGVYEVVPRPSSLTKTAPHGAKRVSGDSLHSDLGTPARRQLHAYLVEDVARLVDSLRWSSLSHLDASIRSPEKLQRVHEAYQRITKIRTMLPLLEEGDGVGETTPLRSLVDALWSELWHLVNKRAPKVPGKSVPVQQYAHVTDFQTPAAQTKSAHYANLAHLWKRMDQQHSAVVPMDEISVYQESRVWKEIPLPPALESNGSSPQVLSYEPHSHRPETNRLLKQFGLLSLEVDGQQQKTAHLEQQQHSVEDCVSAFRVRLVDSMLHTGYYRKKQVRELVDQLLVLEQARLDGNCGSSKCHGTHHSYPHHQVRQVMYQEFALQE